MLNTIVSLLLRFCSFGQATRCIKVACPFFPLLRQLKENGRLTVPLRSTVYSQTLTLVVKKKGTGADDIGGLCTYDRRGAEEEIGSAGG